jgi:hypothetical protein
MDVLFRLEKCMVILFQLFVRSLHFVHRQNIATVLIDDSFELRPGPHVCHRLLLIIARLSLNTDRSFLQNHPTRWNVLPQTANLALKCPHLARQSPTLFRREIDSFRSPRSPSIVA